MIKLPEQRILKYYDWDEIADWLLRQGVTLELLEKLEDYLQMVPGKQSFPTRLYLDASLYYPQDYRWLSKVLKPLLDNSGLFFTGSEDYIVVIRDN